MQSLKRKGEGGTRVVVLCCRGHVACMFRHPGTADETELFQISALRLELNFQTDRAKHAHLPTLG